MRKLFLVFFSIGLVLALGGCESMKSGPPSVVVGSPDDPVSLMVLSDHDNRAQYGVNFMTNPFLPATGSLLPTYNDYVVLKLNFNVPAKAPVMLLRANVTDERGKIYAGYMAKDKFTEFAMNQSPDQANNTFKRNEIDWYYLPNPIFTVEAGKHSYVLVIVGPHPIPDTAMIHVAVSVDNQAKSFDVPMPVSNP